MAPPSELACSASKTATTGFLFGSNSNVTCAIQSVAIEPPSRGASERPITAFIAHLRDSMAVLSHRSRIIQARGNKKSQKYVSGRREENAGAAGLSPDTM